MQIEPLYALLALYMRSIWELWDAQQATRALQDAARNAPGCASNALGTD